MSHLALALAQADQWNRAEASIVQIEDASRRGYALFRLIKAISKANKREHGLAVVQRSWLQATTRKEALYLLQIANPFIVLKAELSVAFFEAFAWVDDFLKG